VLDDRSESVIDLEGEGRLVRALDEVLDGAGQVATGSGRPAGRPRGRNIASGRKVDFGDMVNP
jgi:hypothetical protein